MEEQLTGSITTYITWLYTDDESFNSIGNFKIVTNLRKKFFLLFYYFYVPIIVVALKIILFKSMNLKFVDESKNFIVDEFISQNQLFIL